MKCTKATTTTTATEVKCMPMHMTLGPRPYNDKHTTTSDSDCKFCVVLRCVVLCCDDLKSTTAEIIHLKKVQKLNFF